VALNEQVLQLVKDLHLKVDEAFAAIDALLQQLANDTMWSWLVEPIRSGLNDLRQKATEFFTAIERVIGKMGSKDALMAAGQSWHDQIATPASQVGGTLNLDKLGVDDYWAGLGGNAYKTTVPNQSGAFNDLRIVADGLQSSLTSMANEVDNFGWAVIGAITGAAVGVVGLIAAVAAPPSLPAALGIAAAGFSVAAGILVPAITSIVGFMNSAKGQQVTLKQQLDRVTAWPAANNALATPGNWKVDNNI